MSVAVSTVSSLAFRWCLHSEDASSAVSVLSEFCGVYEGKAVVTATGTGGVVVSAGQKLRGYH